MNPVIESDSAYTVEALCPLCRIRVDVPVTLQTLLKKTTEKTVIHVTLLQETTLHPCGQQRIDDAIDVEDVVLPGDTLALPWADAETGEILDGSPA